MSRTENVIKNISSGFIAKTITILFSFVSRTVFIHYLGNEFLGISGLFTQILQVLSFAELGFGSALNFTMYKPVAEEDDSKITSLLLFYRKVYLRTAIIITVLGSALIPFLQYIVRGANNITVSELRIYYCFFLFNSAVSYLSTFRFSYINALQKNYIQTSIDLLFNIVTSAFQIVIIVIFKNYLIYLLVEALFSVVYQIYVAVFLKAKFPILKNINRKKAIPLSKNKKAEIYTEVKGMAIHQFSSIAVHSTDNIVISAFKNMGVITVALVSNYTLIINGVINYVLIIFNSVTSGFGNLAATSNDEDFRKVFYTSNFINFWIYGFCCIALYTLTPSFIALWLGKEFLIDRVSFGLIILNCYLQGQSTIYNNARIAKGNFQKDKWLALIQSIINLVISVILAKQIGLVGVYIGTIVSRTVYIISRPISTYKYLFGKSCLEYFKKFTGYLTVVLISCAVTIIITDKLLCDVSFIRFLISLPIVFIVPNLLFALVYFKSKEFLDVSNRIKQIKSRIKT